MIILPPIIGYKLIGGLGVNSFTSKEIKQQEVETALSFQNSAETAFRIDEDGLSDQDADMVSIFILTILRVYMLLIWESSRR